MKPFGLSRVQPIYLSLRYMSILFYFFFLEREVRKLFKQQSSRKAAGPDNVSTLKYSANELAPVFIDLFNVSLNLHIVPVCFKAPNIIPVPNNQK